MVETLVLWQGLRIAKMLGISELIATGDSRIVICSLAENIMPNQMTLRQLIHKIVAQVSSFKKIEFFHVLRKNNSKADYEANKGSSLIPGELILNGQGSFCSPP